MAKKNSSDNTRSPTKKEKLKRIYEQQESEKLAKKYIYPISIGLLVFFFITLYITLYFKSLT